MTLIAVHSAMVQPILRLDLTTSIIFSGEIDVLVEDPTLETVVEQDDVTSTLDDAEELVVELVDETVTTIVEQEDC